MSNKSIKPVYTFWNNRLDRLEDITGSTQRSAALDKAIKEDALLAKKFLLTLFISTIVMSNILFLSTWENFVSKDMFMFALVTSAILPFTSIVSIQSFRYMAIRSTGRDIKIAYNGASNMFSFEITIRNVFSIAIFSSLIAMLGVALSLVSSVFIHWMFISHLWVAGILAVWIFVMSGLYLYTEYLHRKNRDVLITQTTLEGENNKLK